MTAPKEFLQSLVPGDLVAATVRSSSKLHLIHFVRGVTADMCRHGGPNAETLARLADGIPLCSARPRSWWEVTDRLESWASSEQCPVCFSAWRGGGRPSIKGWANAERVVDTELRLPWGWEEVAPVGHPLDLPSDAPDPEEDDKEAGERRREVRRWVRGNRYVRLTQSYDDERYAVRYGPSDGEPKEEEWAFKGGHDNALVRACAVMALGGTWTSSTSGLDKMTLKQFDRRS